MAKSKTIADEVIIAALIEHGSATKAAAALGIDRSTIYERQGETDFKNLYERAKADILRTAVTGLYTRLSEANAAIVDIMNDKSVNAAVRLQAAQTVYNSFTKLTAAFMETERDIQKQIDKNDNPFGFF